jgi:putative flippase GtrA
MSAPDCSWIRWLKFNAVGAIGIGVQLVVLALFTSGFGWNYLLATLIAVETTVVHNFFWHERYTWADRRGGASLRRLAKFNLSNGAISIVGNLALMKLFSTLIGLNYLVANALSIACCSVLNFIVSDFFVFSSVAPQSMWRCRSTDQTS